MLSMSISKLLKRYYVLKIRFSTPNKSLIGWIEKGITVSTFSKPEDCLCWHSMCRLIFYKIGFWGEAPYIYIYIKMLTLFPQNNSPDGLLFTSDWSLYWLQQSTYGASKSPQWVYKQAITITRDTNALQRPSTLIGWSLMDIKQPVNNNVDSNSLYLNMYSWH